ncbi:Uncharacterised protein [Enterobacter cloacae]|uniref:Uncharacterized protein n=1 Tax=Enterobacter cloacae TaxID=550 RepID=A0A377M7H3_ENTCL|nr:Uncharacterised protein [Enterobacter cloacae]
MSAKTMKGKQAILRYLERTGPSPRRMWPQSVA